MNDNDTKQRYGAFAYGRRATPHTGCGTVPSPVDGQRNSLRVFGAMVAFAGMGMKRSRGRDFVREGAA